MKKLTTIALLAVIALMLGCSKSNPVAPPTATPTLWVNIHGTEVSIPEIRVSDTTVAFVVTPLRTGGIPRTLYTNVEYDHVLVPDTLTIVHEVDPSWFWRDSLTVTTYLRWTDDRGEHRAKFTKTVPCATISK